MEAQEGQERLIGMHNTDNSQYSNGLVEPWEDPFQTKKSRNIHKTLVGYGWQMKEKSNTPNLDISLCTIRFIS